MEGGCGREKEEPTVGRSHREDQENGSHTDQEKEKKMGEEKETRENKIPSLAEGSFLQQVLTQVGPQVLPEDGLEPGVVGSDQEAVEQAGDLGSGVRRDSLVPRGPGRVLHGDLAGGWELGKQGRLTRAQMRPSQGS